LLNSCSGKKIYSRLGKTFDIVEQVNMPLMTDARNLGSGTGILSKQGLNALDGTALSAGKLSATE
jgi:hypothetical protein